MYIRKKPIKTYFIICLAWVWGSAYWYDCKIKTVCSSDLEQLQAAQIEELKAKSILANKQQQILNNEQQQIPNNEQQQISQLTNNTTTTDKDNEKLVNFGSLDKLNNINETETVKIYFPSGQLTNKTIDKTDYERLNQMIDIVLKTPDKKIVVHGHTDNLGSEEINHKVSLQRAEMIKEIIVAKGIEQSRVLVEGFGGDKPETSNATREGRMKNRRVIVAIVS